MAVDVLMPFRNAAETLPASLASLAAQTIPFRLIAVDDGSTDHSASLVDAAFPRSIIPSRGRGLVAALNTGLDHAHAPLIARMDADDTMRPDRLEKQVAALAGHPDWDAVACRVAYHGDGDGFRRYVDWTNEQLSPEAITLNRFVESPLVHPSLCFRAELIGRFGPYRDGAFPEDYDLWLRWLEAGVVIGKVPEALLTWHDSVRRLSRTDDRYAVDAFYRLKAEYLARWLAAHNPHHPDIVVWGAGYRTRKRVRLLEEHGIRVKAYVDINPRRRGTSISGAPVLMPDALPEPSDAFVVPYVGNTGARALIAERLEARGYRHGRDFICAA
jgi:glycosyltransferase involved in cell wall biosynthesis